MKYGDFMNKCVTILSFSSREKGNCANISKYISDFHQQNIYNIVIDTATVRPCGNCDYECLKPGAECPILDEKYQAIMNRICASDIVYFIIPNFCGYPCANYFAYNERKVGYFKMDRAKMEHYMKIPKRFIVVSNSEGFESVLKQQTDQEPKILYLKSGKYRKRSTAGDILESDEAKADLQTFLSQEP